MRKETAIRCILTTSMKIGDPFTAGDRILGSRQS
jgi:hypothetical protein